MSNLTRYAFHKSIKHRIQTENLANNSHKQFYIVLSTNQMKLYTYPDVLKESPLLRKFFNSESTAYFLDETFYHTNILLFSTTICAAIVIKATKYSMYFIIHNLCDVATEKNVTLSYLVGSIDKRKVYFRMSWLLPKYWKLLPLSHTVIDHAVKHKKTINNSSKFIYLNTSRNDVI